MSDIKRAVPESYRQKWAEAIMGKNFLGCEVAEAIMDRPLSQAEKGALRDMPFTYQTLIACKDTHILVAVPYISLNEIKSYHSWAFDRKSEFKNEQFAKNKLPIGWYLIRKTPAPGSLGRSRVTHELMSKNGLFGEDSTITPANILTYAMVAYIGWRDEEIFQGAIVNTADSGPFEKSCIAASLVEGRVKLGYAAICLEKKNLGVSIMKRIY